MTRRLLIVLAAVVLLALAVAAAGWRMLASAAHTPLVVVETQLHDVRPGSSLRGVLRDLADRGLLRAPMRVEWWARLRDRTAIAAGEYALSPGMTAADLVRDLGAGRVHERRFTIVEGWRLRDLRAAFARAPRLRNETSGLDDEALLEAIGLGELTLEGRCFPDSYRYRADSSDVQLLRRCVARMDEVLAEVWADRSPGVEIRTPEEALVLASIIEKETGLATDREDISGVFHRRLAKGMRLQTDPTVIYGLGDDFDGNLTRAHLRTPHPWNTYVHRGLPPTPIAFPGRAALEAAVHPAPGDALYFVARGDGSSQFSATLEAHEAAVRRFQLGEGSVEPGTP